MNFLCINKFCEYMHRDQIINKKDKNIKNKINECKSNSFPGGLWQEPQTVYAWKDGHPDTKKKLDPRNLDYHGWDGHTFFSWLQVGSTHAC